MMGEINAKAAVGEYLHAIRQIREIPMVRLRGLKVSLGVAGRNEAGPGRSRLLFVTNTVKHFKFEQRGERRLHKRPNAYEIDRCHHW